MSPTPQHSLPGPDDILRVEVDNGLVVLVRENFTSPSVIVDGILRGGSLQTTREQAGLSNFHGSLLMRGTQRYNFNQLYEEIESLGASIDAGGGVHNYRFGSKSLAEDLPVMLDLMAEILREPTFPEKDIETVRGQIMTSLQMRAHSTRSMAGLVFYELAYPDHPFATSTSGYLETVPDLTRQDILTMQKRLGPHDAIIVVVGAVKAAQAVEMVKAAFGGWQNADQPESPFAPPAERISKIRRQFVPIPGKTQSDIVLGFPGPARSEPDFQAARLGNSILGIFGLMGRLGDNVREAQGLAYYSYSQLAGGLGPGPWRVMAGVAPENVDRAVASIRDEIRRMVDEPVTPEELSDNQSFFKGQLLLSLETNEGVAGAMMIMEKHRLGLDYLRNYETMIDSITAANIQAVAQRYLNPDAYALAVAGPEQAG